MTDEGALTERIPRFAIFQKRKVRIAWYDGDGYFRIVDTNDSQRTVHREFLHFLKEG